MRRQAWVPDAGTWDGANEQLSRLGSGCGRFEELGHDAPVPGDQRGGLVPLPRP
jgi:hypothetical protein